MQRVMKGVMYALLGLLSFCLIVVAYVYGQGETQGEVRWQSCYRATYWAWFEDGLPSSKLQCATVSVPFDPDKADTKQFTLALTRLPSKTAKSDLLLLNGGPGAHSLDMALWLNDDEYVQALKDNFHLIGLAQRGVRPSVPFVDCDGKDETKDGGEAYVKACIAKTGQDVLDVISSREAVKDLDIIRQQLGNETWSMIGYSYGSKLVAEYAEHYPKHLHAGVADGVVDTSEDWFTILHNQQAQSQAVFLGFVDWCVANESSCVFGESDEPNQTFIELLKNIEKMALTDQQGESITAESVLTLFDEHLNEKYNWYSLHDMLAELSKGELVSYQMLQEFSRLSNIGFSTDAFVSINCADSAPRQDKATYIAHAKAVDDKALYNNIVPIKDDEYLDACFYWGRAGSDDLSVYQATADTPKLLFVAQQHDLATPFTNAQNMAKRFNSTLIYTPYYGHTVSFLGGQACVDSHVMRYLLDPKADLGGEMILCE